MNKPIVILFLLGVLAGAAYLLSEALEPLTPEELGVEMDPDPETTRMPGGSAILANKNMDFVVAYMAANGAKAIEAATGACEKFGKRCYVINQCALPGWGAVAGAKGTIGTAVCEATKEEAIGIAMGLCKKPKCQILKLWHDPERTPYEKLPPIVVETVLGPKTQR